jgi:hypothetical protein
MSASEARSNRPRPLLLVLLAVVAAIAGWRYLPSFGGGPGFTRTTSADLRSAAIEVVELAEHTLGQPPPEGMQARDPWSFGSRPAPERATPEVILPEPEPQPVQPAIPERPTPPAPRPVGPRPPAVDIVYLGTLGRDDDPVAVFSDGSEIYNAFEGDLVKEQFEVQRIGYESVDLGFVGFPDEPAVRLAIGGRPNGG